MKKIFTFMVCCFILAEGFTQNLFDNMHLHKISTMKSVEVAKFADLIYNYSFLKTDPNISHYYSLVEKDNPKILQDHPLIPLLLNPDSLYVTWQTVSEAYNPPSIILLFHHGLETNYVGLYFDEEEQVRIASSFVDSNQKSIIYFGDCCPDRNSKLRSFFLNTYNYEIKPCTDQTIFLPDPD